MFQTVSEYLGTGYEGTEGPEYCEISWQEPSSLETACSDMLRLSGVLLGRCRAGAVRKRPKGTCERSREETRLPEVPTSNLMTASSPEPERIQAARRSTFWPRKASTAFWPSHPRVSTNVLVEVTTLNSTQLPVLGLKCPVLGSDLKLGQKAPVNGGPGRT